jgi:DNA-binding NarL/FixJ family response regulator
VFAALRAGAVGYLLKDVSSGRLVEAIHAAARGESVLQPSVAAKVVARFARLPDDDPAPRPQPLVVPLSDRELEVMRLLAEGRTNREIAGALYLAEGTVKNHVTNVLAKLGARDRTQAALRARALGLL